MSDDADKCNHPLPGGGTCDNPATDGDTCWIPSHGGDADTTPHRPDKFNDDRAERAIEAAREGFSKAGCARAAGVSHTALERWLDSNPEYDGGYFRAAFTRARHQGERKLVKGPLVNDPMEDREVDGQHARFLLSTSFDYVKTEKRELEDVSDGDGFGTTVVLDSEYVDE